MIDTLVLSELGSLKSEAKTNPESAINNLLNITNNSDLDIDFILEEDVGIHGRLDYMAELRQQVVGNLSTGYYHYARLDADILDELDTMNSDYVTVNENGDVAPVDSDDVLEAIDDVKYEMK